MAVPVPDMSAARQEAEQAIARRLLQTWIGTGQMEPVGDLDDVADWSGALADAQQIAADLFDGPEPLARLIDWRAVTAAEPLSVRRAKADALREAAELFPPRSAARVVLRVRADGIERADA